MYFFVEPNAATAFNDVMTLHLVLHVSNTRTYVMVVLTCMQEKLCDKKMKMGRVVFFNLWQSSSPCDDNH